MPDAADTDAQQPDLLIVEDDEGLCSQYRWSFPGYRVHIAQSRAEAEAALTRVAPQVVVMDLGLPPDPDGVSEGFAFLEELGRRGSAAKAIVVTGNGEREVALRAIALGAYDFCEKPVALDVLRTIVARGLNLFRLEEENRRLRAEPAPSPLARVIAASETMLRVCRDVEKLAGTDVTVMLLGESGTGKEVLARSLHELGSRARGPFVAINCGAIPENLLESELFGHERGAFTGAVKQTKGKIELAHEGTLFLDEIGDLPLPLQVKLLRFLQDQVIERIGGRQQIQVDVRVISATNQSLERLVAEGRFRSDLLYRMNAVTVRIPPLRERGGDAEILAAYYLERFNREFGKALRGFTEAARGAIAAHPWPGNVRELENRIKRAVVMAEGRLIDVRDLELAASAGEEDGPADLDLRAARMRAEREVLRVAMARGNGNLSLVAKLLGISRPTLYALMEAHGMDAGAARAVPPGRQVVPGAAGP
jgi:two-component system NtrC family response regulator